MAHPSVKSHWDKLPNELKDMVLGYNSLLRLFLKGQFKPSRDHESIEIRLLWLEVFDTDWQGDLESLHDPSYQKGLENSDLVRVKSRSMYERLCKRFPRATQANSKFANTDIKITRAVVPYKYAKHQPKHAPPQTPFRLLHIPMRHMWLDVLGDNFYKYPHARANDCILQGHTEMLRHLVDTGTVNLSRTVRVCVIQNHELVYDVMNAVAERGHLDILKMLHDVRCNTITTKAMDWAASNGHLDVVKFLHENRTEGCTTDAMDGAAEHGHLNVVKFLHENRTEGCTKQAIYNAKSRGYLKVVTWLHANRTKECSTKAMDEAALMGRLADVKLLHEDPNEVCTTDAMDEAAKYGRLDVVQWLHGNRTEGCTTNAIDAASKYGHLYVVQFLLNKRSEGFSEDAIKYCKTYEIGKILVQSLSIYRKHQMRRLLKYGSWSGSGVNIFRKSLHLHT